MNAQMRVYILKINGNLYQFHDNTNRKIQRNKKKLNECQIGKENRACVFKGSHINSVFIAI